MTALYVLAPDVLVDATSQCHDGPLMQKFIGAMNDMVAGSELTFPRELVDVCRKYAPGEVLTNWAVPTLGNLTDNEASYSTIEEVLSECPELLDIDEIDLSVSVTVLALAYQRQFTNDEVFVVTNEREDGPGTICLATACRRLSVGCIALHEFATAIGQIDVMRP